MRFNCRWLIIVREGHDVFESQVLTELNLFEFVLYQSKTWPSSAFIDERQEEQKEATMAMKFSFFPMTSERTKDDSSLSLTNDENKMKFVMPWKCRSGLCKAICQRARENITLVWVTSNFRSSFRLFYRQVFLSSVCSKGDSIISMSANY